MRAGSLQELIYKHGQAGITKATVSITFDNRDKMQCPIGYENHDEITVTRQVCIMYSIESKVQVCTVVVYKELLLSKTTDLCLY